MSLNNPHVTICVPAFNAGRTLRLTLESILKQDYPNYDILVSDNASTDNTAEIVREFGARGVRYFKNSVYLSWGENNWNYALSLAEGPLVALYHADDLYTTTMVRRQVEFLLAHPQSSAVFTRTQAIDEQERPIRLKTAFIPCSLASSRSFNFPMLFNAVLKYSNFLTVPTLMARREALSAVGEFNPRFCSAADIDLWLRLSQWGPVGLICEPLHRYRVSEKQGSAQLNRMRTETADYFRVMDDYLSRPEVSKIIREDALAYYEMDRSIDRIYRAMNLLAVGKNDEAMSQLRCALSLRHYRTAFCRPRRLLPLLSGTGLYLLGSFNIGAYGGILLRTAYQFVQKWRRHAINR